MRDIALTWVTIAGLAAGVFWYSGGFDLRPTEEVQAEREADERRGKWCGIFADSGAIEQHEVRECASSQDMFVDAADKVASSDAARDAEVIEQVSNYLRERAKSLNMEAFRPLDPDKGIPSSWDSESDAGKRPDYDRRYTEVAELTVWWGENDDALHDHFTVSGRLATRDQGDTWMLPNPTGAWTQALGRLISACPSTDGADFHGCRATIFLEAGYHAIRGWEPAITFMLLKPVDEAALREHYQTHFRSRW